MVAADTIENSPENQIAFAAVFVEMLSADAEYALRAAGLERERCYAATLRFAAEDFCAAANIPIAERKRDSSELDPAPEHALSLAGNVAVTCFELATFAAREAANPYIRRVADKCATFALLLSRAIKGSLPLRHDA